MGADMTNSDSSTFRLGITRDCLTPDGGGANFDARAFALLDAAPALTWEFLPTFTEQILPADAARYDAIMSLRPAAHFPRPAIFLRASVPIASSTCRSRNRRLPAPRSARR